MPPPRSPGTDEIRCPSCGSERVVPIVYGLPSPEMMERAERREVRLGGCIVTGDDPEWGCLDCPWPTAS